MNCRYILTKPWFSSLSSQISRTTSKLPSILNTRNRYWRNSCPSLKWRCEWEHLEHSKQQFYSFSALFPAFVFPNLGIVFFFADILPLFVLGWLWAWEVPWRTCSWFSLQLLCSMLPICSLSSQFFYIHWDANAYFLRILQPDCFISRSPLPSRWPTEHQLVFCSPFWSFICALSHEFWCCPWSFPEPPVCWNFPLFSLEVCQDHAQVRSPAECSSSEMPKVPR